ncbi:MAG: transposase [Rectinema sp.]
MSKARMQKIKGIEYVYIESSHRIPGRNYPDHKRLYIGKMTNDGFSPNAKFHALSEEEKKTSGLVWESSAVIVGQHRRGRPYASSMGTRKFRGTDLLLSTIADTIGLDDDLDRVFGDRAKRILSLAYYLMANPEAPLYRFSSWARLHYHPYGDDIPSPRSSELLGSITEDEIQQFLRLRIKRAAGNSGWLAVDTTSVSSYSQALSLVAKGHNKEHDRLDQVNLLMVFDQDTEVPVFYRKLRGNITDVTTVENTLHDLRGVGIDGASLVLDRGFYSEDNVKTLLKKRYPFTMGTKISLSFVMEAIKQTQKSMLSFDSYDEECKVFHAVVPVAYAVPVRGRGPNSRTAYLHLYCSKEREADDSAALMKRLKGMRSQLESGTITGSRKALEKFFTFTGDSNDTIVSFSEKQEAINDAMDRCGFFALLTSEKDVSSIDVLPEIPKLL